MHILAYTYEYVHIRSEVCARICAKMKYVYARILYVCCDVFARICTYCTHMRVCFVQKVARRVDVRIFAHTCICVQIRTHIRANTCIYARTYVQKIKDQVQFQRSYMHVYARICTYISTCYAYTYIYELRSYMHVYACICTYIYIYASMLLPLAAQSDCDTVYVRICTYLIVYVCI